MKLLDWASSPIGSIILLAISILLMGAIVFLTRYLWREHISMWIHSSEGALAILVAATMMCLGITMLNVSIFNAAEMQNTYHNLTVSQKVLTYIGPAEMVSVGELRQVTEHENKVYQLSDHREAYNWLSGVISMPSQEEIEALHLNWLANRG